ncbi:MAG: permease prefix domain 2-containing transporter, partial [Bacteroidota bacterium]
MIKRLAHRFLYWFCHPDYFDEIEGDLEELYQRNAEQSKRMAQWKYLLQVLMLFRPSLIRSFPQSYLTQPTMFRHYFNISTRVLLRQKLYTTINTLGLAVGTGVALLICQYVYFEQSYDQFHENYRNTHRVIIDEIRNDTDRGLSPYSDYALGVRAEEEIPEIEQHVRMYVEE